MRVLVTGATGLVGNNVARQLVEQQAEVRVLVRETSDLRPLDGLDLEIVYGDLRNADQVVAACAGVHAVIHAAAWVHIGWSEMDLARQVNVQGSHHVARAARKAGARMIHVSSVDALAPGSPARIIDELAPRTSKTPCPYVVTKRGAEEAVIAEMKRGLDAVIVNPVFMLGPWDWKPSSGRMLLEVVRLFTPLAPSGGTSICDVRDAAAAMINAIEWGETGKRYILAGRNMTYLDLWCLFSKVAGGQEPYGRLGPGLRTLAGRGGDLWGKLSGREPDVNSAALSMSSLFHYYDSARAKSELGYRCRPSEDSIRDAWQWFEDYGFRGAPCASATRPR